MQTKNNASAGLLAASLAVGFLLVSSHSEAARAESNGSFQTVFPVESEAPLANPYMGWGIWVGPHAFGNNERDYSVAQNTAGFGDDAPLFNWVIVDWDWARLEPREGEFNWGDFDAVLNYWAARGRQFVLRFWVTDNPGWKSRSGAPVLPNWIWEKGLHTREYVAESGMKQREPDYADPTYQSIYLPALRRFVTAFADRYDKPGTPIIFLQATGYGNWVDWATRYSRYKFADPSAKRALLARVMEIYASAFKNIRLLGWSGADWDEGDLGSLADYISANALDSVLSGGCGLIWTGFIENLYGWDRDMMQTHWRQHPILAEGYASFDDIQDDKTHGTFDEVLDVALAWHANFTHYYFVVDTYKRAMREATQTIRRGLCRGGLGYRLVPISLSWRNKLAAGQLLVIKQSWMNRNVGRLYVQHPLKLYLTDTAGRVRFSEVDTGFDETAWVRGETYPVMSVFHLPNNMPPGVYDLRIALVDVGGKPRIRLPIAGEDGEMRYKVGTIRVLPPL
jgi:hypothetical protein